MTSIASALDSFFSKAQAVFEGAAQRSESPLERCYEIGGQPIRLAFAQAAMADHLTTAFRHLALISPTPPAWTVYAWDVQSPADVLPPPPWDLLPFFERANLRGYADERFTLIYDRGTDVFTAVDNERQIAVYWTRDHQWLPYYELAAPMRHLLQAWLQHKGIFVTHASAVGTPEGGALLAGRGGSGKSTTAVVCLRAGMRYAGDDFVLTSPEPHPTVFSLYSSAKLNANSLAWMPELMPAVTNLDRLGPEKALIFLDASYHDRLVAQLPLKAILLPTATHHPDTVITVVPPETAYKSIVPDTSLRALGDVRLVFKAFTRLVYDLPCYRVELGTDLSQIPQAITHAIESGGQHR